MEDLKQAILSMMAEKLEDGLKQMEKSATNSKAEQTNEQPESSKNQQLLHDLKHNKEENMLQFEKIQKETEAINIKISQLELKMSEMEPKNYKQSHQESQEKLHVCDNDKLNQKCDDANWLRTELETKAAICRNQEFKISQLQEDLKCQEQLNLRKVYKYRKELEEKDDLCYQLEQKVAQARGNPQHLLDKLKGQAEIHLREVNELRKELEAKDNICHQLEVEVTQVRENPEFIRMRQLLDEHKSQVYLLSCEVSELRKELEVKDNICHQLENEVIQARENPQLLKLVEDLKNQENLYVHEINELRNELEVKDDICHQLEDQVIQVRESPEFIEMRQQLLDDLKAQEERHLGESNELRQELEAKITKCEETEQELEQLRDRHNLSVSCPICMEPWDSSNHRLVALTCGHLFGETCVRESLQRNPTCPECRANVSTNDIRQLFARC